LERTRCFLKPINQLSRWPGKMSSLADLTMMRRPPSRLGLPSMRAREDIPRKARNPFRTGARVTFFGAKKVTRENIQVEGKSATGDVLGIFLRDIPVS